MLIVGAGLSGSVLAERFADSGREVLVLERRRHTAGNCFDYAHPSGVFLHKYGPHYFRTSDERLVRYLDRFTRWIPGNYVVKSCIDGRLHDFPINLNTLEAVFGRRFTPASARAFMTRERVPIEHPRTSEEHCLSMVGRRLYELFYKGYSLKQWDRDPSRLDASVAARIPVRYNRNEKYVDADYLITPRNGFTKMFDAMLGHPRIEVRLGTDYLRAGKGPGFQPGLTIFTGCADEYFGYRFGRLPYRSLRFRNVLVRKPFAQPCAQVNYPSPSIPYTRTVEIKHVTGQELGRTIVTYEYPRSQGEPFYPVPGPESQATWRRYVPLIKAEERRGVFFCGRLATYRYLNMDQCLEEALALFERLKRA